MARSSNNTIMISVDDLFDYVQFRNSFGVEIQTPNMDRLAAMGVTFEHAYASIALCSPSRTSILSGRDPYATGVIDNGTPWEQRVELAQTLPGVYRTAGYETVSAGKTFHTLDPEGPIAAELFDHAMLATSGYNNLIDNPFRTGAWTGDPSELGDAQTVAFLEDYFAQLTEESLPQFIMAGIYRPHGDWVVPQEYFDLYPVEEIEIIDDAALDLVDVPEYAKTYFTTFGRRLEDADFVAEAVQGYLASITYADAQVGRLLDAIEASAIADDVSIILYSDHGYHLGSKDHWHKFSLWEEAARAPLIVVDPTLSDYAGTTSSTNVSLLDIYATALDMADLPIPEGSDSTSLLPLIDGTAEGSDQALTSMYGSLSLKTGDYRVTRYADGSYEVYNIALDPTSQDNLAHESVYQDNIEILDPIFAEFYDYLAEHGFWVPGMEANPDARVIVNDGTMTVMEDNSEDNMFFMETGIVPLTGLPDGGEDTAIVAASYVLPDHIENMIVVPPSSNSQDPVVSEGNELNNNIASIARPSVILGYGGDDFLNARGVLSDYVDGGDGNDTLQSSGGGDSIYGGSGDDIVSDYGGDNNVYGGSGNDSIFLLSGDDSAYGESGGDLLLMGNGDDFALGGGGHDSLNGGFDTDTIKGNNGNDIIYLGEGDDQGYGGNGDDTLFGGLGDDTLKGGAGNNRISGEEGNDFLTDEDGDSSLFGGTEDDVLRAGAGSDFLYGGDGDDRIFGEAGNDTLHSDLGTDLLDGGEGQDRFVMTIGEIGKTWIVASVSDGDAVKFIGLEGVTASDLVSMAVQRGANTVIDLPSDEKIILKGFDKAELTEDFFILS